MEPRLRIVKAKVDYSELEMHNLQTAREMIRVSSEGGTNGPDAGDGVSRRPQGAGNSKLKTQNSKLNTKN